jgi:methanogenic corrinoid protein MtbC1
MESDDGGTLPQDVIPPWAELLGETIQSEILPRLLSAYRDDSDGAYGAGQAGRYTTDVYEFVALILADDMEQARAEADRVIVQSGGRDRLLQDLLRPAALMIGEMWEHDDCDFMSVTLGVYRLDQIMKETATVGDQAAILSGHDHRILLLPAPGEQHSFGLGMVADAFREGGWCVRSGPAVSRSQLSRLVRDEWFDVVGLSVTSDRALNGLPSCIRAVRFASCNPDVFVMLGGHAINEHEERTRFLGADATARDAQGALAAANIYVKTTVTEGLHQSKTRLVDIG